MRGSTMSGIGIALLLCTVGAPAQARGVVEPIVPVPSTGNVAVARLVIQSPTSGTAQTPRLGLTNRSLLPTGAYAVATVTRAARAGQFVATVAVVRPATSTSPAPSQGPNTSLVLRLPPGSRLVSGPHWVNDVLYVNRRPSFGLVSGGVTSVLAGQNPSLISAALVTKDAQLLALDRTIPMLHARALGLQYIAVAFPNRAGTALTTSIGLAGLTQVNAIELQFPAGIRVTAVKGPTGTEGLLLGSAVQLISSGGRFRDGLLYTFALQLSRPPASGDAITIRASEHYFEGSLPFTERVVLGQD